MLNYSMTKRPIPKKQIVTTRFKEVIRPPKQFFRSWRKYRGMTLEQAASLADMTAGNLSAMERGAQGYTTQGLEALAQAYRTSPGWLLEVDPMGDDAGLISLLGRANDTQRKMIVQIAETIIGKTGTEE